MLIRITMEMDNEYFRWFALAINDDIQNTLNKEFHSSFFLAFKKTDKQTIWMPIVIFIFIFFHRQNRALKEMKEGIL